MSAIEPKRLDLAAARARLAAMKGKAYWRSLDELAETEEFQEFLHREFPERASEWGNELSRRKFLKIIAASLALAGLSACTRQPEEKIVPYAAKPPENLIPGKPLFYATAMTLGGYATGLLVESHEGRPTKIEGNPEHPASLGATDVFAQAAILTFYDPDRSQIVTQAERINTWDAFFAALGAELEKQKLKQGAGLRILTETVTSPTLAQQLRVVLEKFPAAKWHQYEPVGLDNTREGARLAFGEFVETRYRFDKADVIVSLDADFLMWGAGRLRYARDFIHRRRVRESNTEMNRLYVFESTPTNTGAMADHRFPVKPSEVHECARMLASLLEKLSEPPIKILKSLAAFESIARDLLSHKGRSIVLAGESQPPIVHALAHQMNHALGNVGSTIIYIDPIQAAPLGQTQSLRELATAMESGKVETLLILGGNPVFTAPANLDFAERMKKVGFRAHLSLYEDETSELCHWHLPETHFLESWGDARAFDGTATIQQPLIAPLYRGKSAHEFLAAVIGERGRSGHDIVRAYWKTHGLDDDKQWQTALHDGVVKGTTFAEKKVELHTIPAMESPKPSGIQIIFRPDSTIWDGQFANNGWLQELPKPLTKLTWDNAAFISPATAERLGIRNEQMVELQRDGRTLMLPAWILPGQPDDCVTVHFGYGRRRAGRVGSGTGFDAYAFRTSDASWFADDVKISPTEKRHRLACTQHHQMMEGRHLVRAGTLAEFKADPKFAQHIAHEPPKGTLYPEFKYDGYAWGMAIDLGACIGCNACIVGCQSENNIPIVGKDEVLMGREMHWIRVDHYHAGALENPETHHQPVPCMHCENAPCEQVCPVAATSHSAEGLNEMTYNRCVGTRYCSNNCPYKVRRFNFLQYSDEKTESLKLMRNPNVTVRTRGVMEKCTYCVQRINAARISAKKSDRKIRDGEIVPACVQACPSEAIVFGDINDPNSRVSKWKASPLNYGILTELNTKPRTTYLARARNPNPELERQTKPAEA